VLPINFRTAPDDTKVCYCNEVTLGEIKMAIEGGASSLEDIQEATGACTGNACEEKNPSGGCCETDILKILLIFGVMEDQSRSCGCDCCGD